MAKTQEAPHAAADLATQIAALDARLNELQRDRETAIDDLIFGLGDDMKPAQLQAQIEAAQLQRQRLSAQMDAARRSDFMADYKARCAQAAALRLQERAARATRDKAAETLAVAQEAHQRIARQLHQAESDLIFDQGKGFTPADHRALAQPMLAARFEAGLIAQDEYASNAAAAERAEARLQADERREPVITY
jgi:hypothetical protein